VSTIKSSAEDLTLNADGSGNDIKFQINAVEKASISSAGLLTSTTIDATALTGNLPAIDGSSLTGIGGGKVLQVVSTTKTDTFYTATSGSWVDITGLSASITPASTSNKVLISYNVMGESSSSSYAVGLRMMRGSTAINVGGASSSRTQASTASDSYAWGDLSWSSHASVFLDSPSTTSATTYKLAGFGSTGFYVNRNHTSTDTASHYVCTSSITLMEIGA